MVENNHHEEIEHDELVDHNENHEEQHCVLTLSLLDLTMWKGSIMRKMDGLKVYK